MGMYRTKLTTENKTYYGWYNSSYDRACDQFYETEAEAESFYRKENPKTPKFPTKEMKERSVAATIENDYANGISFEVLFDPETMVVVFNHEDQFHDDLSDGCYGRNVKTMKEAYLGKK